jgi:hypothetical protein
MFKLTAIAGLLFATAIFATIPISPQVTPRGLELSVDPGAGSHLWPRPSSYPPGRQARLSLHPTRRPQGRGLLRRSLSAVPVLMTREEKAAWRLGISLALPFYFLTPSRDSQPVMMTRLGASHRAEQHRRSAQ